MAGRITGRIMNGSDRYRRTPGVVKLLHWFEDTSSVYLVMESVRAH